jgi:hypothetical protein
MITQPQPGSPEWLREFAAWAEGLELIESAGLRAAADRLEQLEAERDRLREDEARLIAAGNNLAAEFCQWCPHENRRPFLAAWDAARKEGA